MISVRRLWALPAFAAVAVLLLGVAACAGGEEGDEGGAVTDATSSTPAPTSPPAPPAPPPPPKGVVRVVDGDSAKPVRGALVVVAGERARTGGRGVARLEVPRRRPVTVRVSARGYGARAIRVSFRKHLAHRVPLWRPALQWPMYGVNPGRTQAHAKIKIRPPFRLVWKRRLYGLLEFPAMVWEGVAYVNNIHGWLRALSMKNGRVLWKRRIGTRIASSPGIDPKRRLLVTTSMDPGYVNVLDLDTGRIKWRFYSGRTEPSPLIRNGVAYFGTANGEFYALDLDRRRPRWVFGGGVKITGSPAFARGRLYFGDYAGRVFALSARTGRVVWTGSAGSRVYGTVAVAGGRVFAPSVFSGLSALSARTGRLLWRLSVGNYLYSSPAVFRNRVYFGTYESLVYSVDARSGRIHWTRSAGGRVSGAVEVVAGVLYAASIDDTLRAWHWRTGRQVWEWPHGEYVPVSGNGARLLIHGLARIWAVEPRGRR
jgi:outer membrane protein assembly factor BamB